MAYRSRKKSRRRYSKARRKSVRPIRIGYRF